MDVSIEHERVVVVAVNHLPHPVDLPVQVTVVRPGDDTRLGEWRPIRRVRPDSRTNNARVLGNCPKAFELGYVASHDGGSRPTQHAVRRVSLLVHGSRLVATAERDRNGRCPKPVVLPRVTQTGPHTMFRN